VVQALAAEKAPDKRGSSGTIGVLRNDDVIRHLTKFM
jgi:hypothetical protein